MRDRLNCKMILFYRDLMEELVPYIREAVDRKQENMRRRRRRDALRLQLVRVLELIAEYGTFGIWLVDTLLCIFLLTFTFNELDFLKIIFFQLSSIRSRNAVFTSDIRRVHRWCTHLSRKRDRQGSTRCTRHQVTLLQLYEEDDQEFFT